MRPWLVFVGMLFLTLAGGLVASLLLASGGNTTTSTTVTHPPVFSLAPNATATVPLSGFNGSSEQLTLNWVSTRPIHFVLQSPAGCSGGCWTSSTLAIWLSNMTGSWQGSGPFHFPLLCLLHNPLTQSTNISLTSRAVATSPTMPSLELELVVGAGAAALFAVGGLAVFLGVFLRTNPYAGPRALVSRSANDVEELTKETNRVH